MTSYENRQPSEGINTTDEHPLKALGQLVAGIGLLIVIGLFILNYLIDSLARYVPFAFEKNTVSKLDVLQVKISEPQRYLQKLADRLVKEMELDQGVTITLHYTTSDVINAFATVGGHVFFFKGLISKMKSEQELAAVMAHEIAHIKHRHPIIALGKSMALEALATFISGASDSNAGNWLIGNSINLSLLQFSRNQERAADASAAKALYKIYGHIGGADQLFQRFSMLEGETDYAKSSKTLELFRSHPFSTERWQALKVIAELNEWPLNGPFTPLVFPKVSSIDKKELY